MKIFIDTNVLISAILYPSGVPSQAFLKAAAGKNTLFISRQNIDELYRVFRDKFPDDLPRLDAFVETAMRAVQIVEIPQKPAPEEFQIRDADDRPIIRAALAAGARILLTGDKDFLEAPINQILAMTPTMFLKLEFLPDSD